MYSDKTLWCWLLLCACLGDQHDRESLKLLYCFRAVKLSANLMKRAMAKRIRCTILYATETGHAHQFAKQLAELFKHTFDARVSQLHVIWASEPKYVIPVYSMGKLVLNQFKL